MVVFLRGLVRRQRGTQGHALMHYPRQPQTIWAPKPNPLYSPPSSSSSSSCYGLGRLSMFSSSRGFFQCVKGGLFWNMNSSRRRFPSTNAFFQLSNARNQMLRWGYSRGRDIPPDVVLWGLISTNIAVFLMWQFLDTRFMLKHFMVSIDSISNGRIHTLLTYAFSHKDTGHIFSNMIGLYFFGSEIGALFGGSFLLKLYLLGAITGAIGHMTYYHYVYPWIHNIPRKYFRLQPSPGALGASGSVTGLILLSILLYPKRIIWLNFIIPVPAALLGVFMIGRDLWGSAYGNESISTGGHLGGALVGVLAWLRVR